MKQRTFVTQIREFSVDPNHSLLIHSFTEEAGWGSKERMGNPNEKPREVHISCAKKKTKKKEKKRKKLFCGKKLSKVNLT